MKNLKMMMLTASVLAAIFAFPSCNKSEKVSLVPPTEQTPGDPDEETPTDPDEETPTDPDEETPTDPDEDDSDDDDLPVASVFSEITRAHVAQVEAQMSTNSFLASDANGIVLQPGTVLVYKTNKGNLGKLEIKSIDKAANYKLTIHAVTFNADGSIANEKTALTIRGTYSCDLDQVLEADSDEDFFWSRHDDFVTYFEPADYSKFVKMTFPD